jgi:hypothetical protein
VKHSNDQKQTGTTSRSCVLRFSFLTIPPVGSFRKCHLAPTVVSSVVPSSVVQCRAEHPKCSAAQCRAVSFSEIPNLGVHSEALLDQAGYILVPCILRLWRQMSNILGEWCFLQENDCRLDYMRG